jgi:predicted Rossmann fold nucleotide-binding protein DprA/Smf involved in DNA uptake
MPVYGPKKQRLLTLLRQAPATADELATLTGSTKNRTDAMLYWLKLQGEVHLTGRSVPRQPGQRGSTARFWEARR